MDTIIDEYLENYNLNYLDSDSKKAYQDLKILFKEIDPKLINNFGFLIIKADSLMEGKTLDIISFLRKNDINIISFKIKSHFYESEKEALYRYNLNDGRNNWYIRKEIFEIGPCLALLATYNSKDYNNFFEKIKSIKGISNSIEAQKGTIRRDFNGKNMVMNIIHSSDDPIATIRESKIFFNLKEINDSLVHIDNDLTDEIAYYMQFFENQTSNNFNKLYISLINQIFYSIKNILESIFIFEYFAKDYKLLNIITVDDKKIYNLLITIENKLLSYMNEINLNNSEQFHKLSIVLKIIFITKQLLNYSKNNSIKWEDVWNTFDENNIFFNKIQKLIIQCGFDNNK